MKRFFYSDTIQGFCQSNSKQVLGILSANSTFNIEQNQRDAWFEEIKILQTILKDFHGMIYFEYSIPRMGKRIDVILIINHILFILEFKVGESEFPSHALDQVMDYALDMKNFHETSHDKIIAPILISTNAELPFSEISFPIHHDDILYPIKSNGGLLKEVIKNILIFIDGSSIDIPEWENGRYSPTPTIIEAAMALYSGHSVEEISRRDASAKNLKETSDVICEAIERSKIRSRKTICFVTGVPGAGKTLVGLNIATKYIDKETDTYSVFLSGNGPLVEILREALARDKLRYEKTLGNKIKKYEVMSEVKMFIQNVHHFRDECLVDENRPPIEHVALFDEAQRAWNKEQTSNFMKRKRKQKDFNRSEPDFLISCMDRHNDWAMIVCLVGGGQEIHTGEAGISEWIESLVNYYPEWDIYISSRLNDSEYGAGAVLQKISDRDNVVVKDDLHLSVSMRSFRAENVSLLVKQILDMDNEGARKTLEMLNKNYPIVITRDLMKAKKWLKEKARGSERYGLVVSSQAERLKPYAIDVKSPMDPIHWFLDSKEDVRSSYYLESVATEFQIQGLELDWVCINWDADFRYSKKGWEHWAFKGKKWQHIKKAEKQDYLKNAYRVLLTRARQGMVIVVPPGDPEDNTRKSDFYDPTYKYLKSIGFEEL